ncbi:hypothetical protein NHX12_031871 [Muraenolepis orangiensis]|uniref:2',3'-cyclic-nucleotide 3'-phosphodiesterase n=1 Tax=Muraenolepis orangiensis TaxID=630683 RepID=A0A9Q0IK31_9TELE|nr:hypothetical protein NHX12_031871 [Muraenolepis orangiensis]
MDVDKCQEDFNTMSEQVVNAMENMAVSVTKEQEKAPAVVVEPQPVAVNGHNEAELSPASDKQANAFPESAAQPEETLPMETSEQDVLPHVPDTVEEPVAMEAPSEAVPAQPDSSPEKVSEPLDQEAPPNVAEEPMEEISEVIPASPKPGGSPEKLSEAPERDVAQDVPEKVAETTGADEPSGAQRQPDGSLETASPPDVIMMGTESEELKPDPLPAVEADPEPKAVESVPELASQTSPEPDKMALLVEPAVHKEEMPAAEVEVAMQTAMEKLAVEQVLTTVLTAVEQESPKPEEVLGKPVEGASENKVCSMVPSQTEAVPSAEVLNTKQVEAVKEEETKKPAQPNLTAAIALDPVVQEGAHVDQMEPTKKKRRRRGLPGSGKSFLAGAINDSYQNICSVLSSDDHDVTSADGYKALDEAVIACASAMVVVDDTNHFHDRLACLADIAGQNRRVALFLEPGTEWCRDIPQLVKRTRRGLDEAQIQVMKGTHDEVSIPLFFAWFLLQDKLKCTAMDFLKTLDSLDAFKKHLADFPVETEKEVDLEQYFNSDWSLHCTTKYCNYGKAKGAKEYAEQTAVKTEYSTVSELSLTALFVTPRTVGARVALSEAQMALWPAGEDDDQVEASVPGSGTLPLGSRAHISLGCAAKVNPVQTGLDLLDILVLQRDGQQGDLVEEMELGSLVYLEKGRWLLTLREPISVQGCFSSSYEAKEAEVSKKEPEKKKKAKCAIL